MKIEIDAIKRTVRIAGENYQFEFFEQMAGLKPTDVIRIKHDFQSDTLRIQPVIVVTDVGPDSGVM